MGIPAALGVADSQRAPAGDRANAVLSGTFAAVGPSQPINLVGWANVSVWASYNTTLTTTAGSTAATVASAGAIAAGQSVNGANVPVGTTVGAIAGTAVTLALPTISLAGELRANGLIAGLASTDGLVGSAVTGTGVPAGATVASIVTAAVRVPSSQGGKSTLGVVQLSTTATTEQIGTGTRNFNFALTGNAVLTGADTAALFTGSGIAWSGAVQLERSFDGGKTFIVFSQNLGGARAAWDSIAQVSSSFAEPESGVLYRINCTAYNSGVINYRLSTTGGGSLPSNF